MAKCNTDEVLSLLSVNKVSAKDELIFSVLQDNDSCIKIKTDEMVAVDGTHSVFNSRKRPADAFSCLAVGCRNTGTNTITGSAFPIGATFQKVAAATDVYAGASTFYVELPADGTYTLTYKIADIAEKGFANADVYKKEFTGKQGFNALFIDFSIAPEEVLGEGWKATDDGILVDISINTDAAVEAKIGLSSISFYNSIEELQNDNVVTIGCISEYGGDMNIDVSESVCFGSKYDPSTAAITRTFTAGKMSGNYWLLNPFLRRGSMTKGWKVAKGKDTVKETTIDGRKYGYIALADLSTEECSYAKAIIASECNFMDAELSKLNLPYASALDENQFQILKEGKMLVHESLIGQVLLYSYPKKVNVEQFIGDDTSFNERTTRLFFSTTMTDGTEVNYIFNNVLVTSFPTTLSSTEETAFEFEISVQKDANGRFFEMQRVLD